LGEFEKYKLELRDKFAMMLEERVQKELEKFKR
jgi:hypothetical protein